MEEKAAPKVPKQTIVGLVCFALSGALLAIDVGAAHALQSEDGAALPDPSAAATPPALVAAATCPAPARALPSAAHVPGIAPLRLPREHPVVHARLVGLHIVPNVHSLAHAGLSTLNVAANTRRPVTATFATLRIHNSDRRLVLAPRAAEQHPLVKAPAAPSGMRAELVARPLRPLPTANLISAAHLQPAAHLPSAAYMPTTTRQLPAAQSPAIDQPAAVAHRTSVQAAQYYAVHMAEAQTPGMHLISAVTRKRGRDRLVVHIVAHSRTGTLLEYEVLRRNGIGFAVESRTVRSIAAVSSLGDARRFAADLSEGP